MATDPQPLLASALKDAYPLTADAALLCDHLNARVGFKLWERVSKGGEADPAGVGPERVAHLLMLTGRLHAAALAAGILPLLKETDAAAAEEAQAGLAAKEELLAKIAASKKDSDECARLMGEYQKACEASMASLEAALGAVVEQFDEGARAAAADRMEAAKATCNLAPGAMAYA